MVPGPPLMGSASVATPMTAALSGPPPTGGADPMTQTISQIRQVASSVDDLGSNNPSLAPEVQAIKSILRQMIVKAAQAATAQTPSAEALPMGGG